MSGLAVPGTDKASEATLGTTAASISPRGRSIKPGALPDTDPERKFVDIHALPAELHVYIMSNLKDPASQICFGLTSSYFYWKVYHEVADEKDYGNGNGSGKRYRHRVDLRLQVSICGQYTLYDQRREYGYLLDAWDIDWHNCLNILLCKERWLWGNLRYCEGCAKYKSESAFGEISGQQEIWMTVEDRHIASKADFPWLETICKRCRAKELFRYVGEREEVRETWGNAWEERESFGLKWPEANGKGPARNGLWDECDYETWESIFLKMGI